MSCADVVGFVEGPNGEIPVSYDGLTNTSFRVIFEKANSSVFFLQSFNLPSVRIREVKTNTPLVDMNEIGEKIDYTPFEMSFMVDADLRNYRQVYNWMKRMTVRGSKVGETDTVLLSINGKESIRFYGCWPMELSDLEFVTNPDGIVYMKCTLIVNYDYFLFEDEANVIS